MIIFKPFEILQRRAGQNSFHVASEKALRIEFMRFRKKQVLGPLNVEGDVVITCLEGTFTVGIEDALVGALTQVVVPEGEPLKIGCSSDEGAVQIIWAPPFATAK